MSLITPDLILQPFATRGNVKVPPQTDAQGFVNFAEGYTSFYEIDLKSNNPQAKAVDRLNQNYLFNQASMMTKAWQSLCIPPWYSTMPDGYAKNALVMREVSLTEARPYRSLVADNKSDPLSSSTWEYVATVAELLSSVPMPAGGEQGPQSKVITVTTDFNSLRNGTVVYANSNVATASANSPVRPRITLVSAGILEAMEWGEAGARAGTQRYTSSDGSVAVRGSVNGAFTPWVFTTSQGEILASDYNSTVLRGTSVAYLATIVPAPAALTMGLTINVQMNVTCGANPTLNLNALGIRPIVGGNGNGAKAGELIAGRLVKLTFSTANNSWLIMSQSAGALQVSPGLDLIHAPQIQQVQSSAFNYAPDSGSTAVANAYKCVTSPVITAITDGLALSFRAATTNTAVSAATFEVAGRRLVILDVQGNALLPGAIKAGSMYSIIYSSASDRWYMQTAIPAAPIPDADGQVAGIVTLSDAVNDSVNGVNQGYAATPKAVSGKMSKGILLGTTNLNTLDKPVSVGFYLQQQDANATIANGYPTTQAGTLLVTDGPYGTMQEYTTYAGGKKYLRAVVNGLAFRPWNDITQNRYLPGQIVQMALPIGSPPPLGLLVADGSNLGRANYPDLFAAIGTTWNLGGEGAANFAIPNAAPRAALLSANGITTPLAGENKLLYTNGVNASHTHTADTSSAGSHTHTAWSDPAGIHTHPGATTNVTGEHTHPITNAGYYRYAGNDLLGSTQGAGNTGASGSHSHTVNIPNDGGHSHSIGINAAGAHVHPVTVQASGASGSMYYNTPVNIPAGICFMTYIAY